MEKRIARGGLFASGAAVDVHRPFRVGLDPVESAKEVVVPKEIEAPVVVSEERAEKATKVRRGGIVTSSGYERLKRWRAKNREKYNADQATKMAARRAKKREAGVTESDEA